MTLLLTLRARTREAHERLEDELDVLERCQDASAYAALLAGFRSVYAPLERALDASRDTPRVLPDWAARRKTAWLDSDLEQLDVALPPDAADVPVRTAEDVAGAAYVMEGATLGGAVVLRRLRERWTSPLPHRFFTSYGEQRGRMWRTFRDHLDALPDLEPDPVVASAERTFAAFSSACLRPTR